MKKYILFDNDGVLVETEYWFFMANKVALADLDYTLELDEYLRIMPTGISCWNAVIELNLDPAIITKNRQKRDSYYQEYLKSENIEIPGVESILKTLSREFKMSVITTSKKTDFDLIHEKRNLIKYMDFVLTHDDYERAKPHPDPYLKGMELFGASREEVLVVEDSERGLKSAVAAGLDCAIVHNEFTKDQDFSKATHRINTLRELPDLLRNL